MEQYWNYIYCIYSVNNYSSSVISLPWKLQKDVSDFEKLCIYRATHFLLSSVNLFLYSFGIYSAWWRNVTGKTYWKQFKQQEKTKQAADISYKLLISLSMILENVTVEMKLTGILNPPDKLIKGAG